VSFLPLDVTNEDSVNSALSHIDNAMQYGEDEEPKMPDDMDEGLSSKAFDRDFSISLILFLSFRRRSRY
jgi:hypothetical protein